KKTEVQNAEIKLKEAKDALEKSQVKDSVDTMVGFYQYITEQYGEKYTRIAQDLAEKAKGNKFSSVDEALAAFEEYQNVLNKKFSAADRNDIFNALESVNYDEWAKHLEKISKSLKVTGYLSSGYDIVSELLKAKDTGDWKPLFLVIEKQAVDIGIGYVVAVVFSLITGAPLGIFSVAIVTAILCSYLDKDVLNKLNESLGI
ncbi:TPA: colicin-like pore-forming protein, partial [Escherichia coli]